MIFKGSGLVWDKEKKQVLCKFEDGQYETDVKREQDILKKLDYEVVEEDKPKKKDEKKSDKK